ncbi:serine threonine- kinase pats1 [Brachionus plicatilis]|uniref:Serine threonine-kinase pats1 n=1 Tax=Brachionus plicatilis TaxID=10195 RepID=A0A3M7SDY4_BRAPC|nr:serine threonine- kinase pats1 [Brachionus plicatilis]
MKAFSLLLKYVRQELSKSKKPKRTEEPTENNNVIDSNNTAIQELYELTQRKFLRQLIQISNQVSTSRLYPRLLCIDFIDEEKISKLKFIKRLRNVAATVEPEDMNYARAESLEENSASSKLIPCIRPMCEHEESWHFSDCIVILPELLSSYCPFLVRIISILRNGSSSNELGVFLSEQGNNLFNDMKEKSQGESLDMGDSYHSFRSFFISEFENDGYYSLSWLGGNSISNPLGLENCELRNGKILWMCKKHIEETDAEILSDQDNFTSNQIEQEKNNLIEELDESFLKDRERETERGVHGVHGVLQNKTCFSYIKVVGIENWTRKQNMSTEISNH